MKMLRVLSILALALFVVSCSQDKDDAKIDPAKSLTIVSDAASQLRDVFSAATSGDRDKVPQTTTRNFYPSATEVSEVSNPLLNNPDTIPNDLGAGTYFFTDSEGNRNELIIGSYDNEKALFPVELITYPANSISVNYMYEKVWVKANNWDPRDPDTKLVDYTARDPYYVQYFDGKRENITVKTAGNGVFSDTSINLAYYDDIADFLSIDTADSNDYYSQSDFTFTYNGTQYGEGKRAYAENKDASEEIVNAYTKEYSSRGYEILWGLWSKKQNESYYNVFTKSTGLEESYSIIDIGKGLLWFLEKDEQYLGYAAKQYDSVSGELTYDSQYIFHKNGFLGFDQYGVEVLALSGTSTDMKGTLKVYKKWRKPNNDKFDVFPVADSSYAAFNPKDYQLSQSEIDAAFRWPCTWNIRSVVIGTRSGETTQFEISTTELLIPAENGEDTLLYSATVTYDIYNKLFAITINDDSGKEIVTINSAKVQAGFIEGVATIDGKDYDIKLPILGSGGLYKAVGEEAFTEL